MNCGLPSPRVVVGALILILHLAGRVPAAEPLYRQIDRAIEAKLSGDLGPLD